MRSAMAAVLSAPFSPPTLAGLHLWLDATRVAGADSDPIGTWSDLSGGGHDAVQATGSKKPILKLGVLGGKNALRWDGVDDALEGVCSALSDLTIFGVVSTTNWRISAAVESYFFSFGTDKPEYGNNQATANFMAFDTAARQFTDLTLATSTPYVLSSWRTAGGYNGAKNGTVSSSNPVAFAFVATATTYQLGLQVPGANQCWVGDMGEIIVYNRSLSDNERRLVERYLGAKWGVSVG